MTKIISSIAENGGVGKSQSVHQIAGFLSKYKELITLYSDYFKDQISQADKENAKNSRILLIDQDEQENLSNYYGVFAKSAKGTTASIYKPEIYGDVSPITVRENIDLVPAHAVLRGFTDDLATNPNKNFLMLFWIKKNIHMIREKYDYIIIDNHAGTYTLQQNALVVSDFVISQMEPDLASFTGLGKIEGRLEELKKEIINPATQESMISAELILIGNKIEKNTKLSRRLREYIETNEANRIFGFIERKSLFPNSVVNEQNIWDYLNDPKSRNDHRDFFKNTFELFNRMKNRFEEK